MSWLDLIPHRHPFLFVDTIVFLEEEKSARAFWTPSPQHWIFRGHFPEHPVLPGVILLEAMAQVACALGRFLDPASLGTPVLLAGADRVRFRRVISPGETLEILVHLKGRKRGFWQFQGRAMVKGEKVAEAELLAATPKNL